MATAFLPRLRVQRPDLATLLYHGLRLAGFTVTCVLVSWGLFVFAMLMIGSLDFDLMMAQLANLSDRYVAADAARVAQFKHLVLVAQLLLLAAVMFFRRHALLAPLVAKDPSHG